jgi:Polyketide cyclase / dehydrase and lipid transport
MYILLAVVALVLLVAGVAYSVMAPPKSPPAYDGEKPPVAEDGYISNTEVSIFDVSLAQYSEYISQIPLEAILNGGGGGGGIRVEGTTVIKGTWNEVGARRRVNFTGGHYAAEDVLVQDEPRVFRYQTWGFTNYARLVTDYLIGEFNVEETPDGKTRITWTYSFHKNSLLSDLLLPNFVKHTIAELMSNTIRSMKQAVEQSASLKR